MSEGTGRRIATALESIALTLATLLPGDGEAPPEPQDAVFQTSDGPMVMRDGKLTPLE